MVTRIPLPSITSLSVPSKMRTTVMASSYPLNRPPPQRRQRRLLPPQLLRKFSFLKKINLNIWKRNHDFGLAGLQLIRPFRILTLTSLHRLMDGRCLTWTALVGFALARAPRFLQSQVFLLDTMAATSPSTKHLSTLVQSFVFWNFYATLKRSNVIPHRFHVCF